MSPKPAGIVANQMLHSAVSGLGLHCLLRIVRINKECRDHSSPMTIG